MDDLNLTDNINPPSSSASVSNLAPSTNPTTTTDEEEEDGYKTTDTATNLPTLPSSSNLIANRPSASILHPPNPTTVDRKLAFGQLRQTVSSKLCDLFDNSNLPATRTNSGRRFIRWDTLPNLLATSNRYLSGLPWDFLFAGLQATTTPSTSTMNPMSIPAFPPSTTVAPNPPPNLNPTNPPIHAADIQSSIARLHSQPLSINILSWKKSTIEEILRGIESGAIRVCPTPSGRNVVFEILIPTGAGDGGGGGRGRQRSRRQEREQEMMVVDVPPWPNTFVDGTTAITSMSSPMPMPGSGQVGGSSSTGSSSATGTGEFGESGNVARVMKRRQPPSLHRALTPVRGGAAGVGVGAGVLYRSSGSVPGSVVSSPGSPFDRRSPGTIHSPPPSLNPYPPRFSSTTTTAPSTYFSSTTYGRRRGSSVDPRSPPLELETPHRAGGVGVDVGARFTTPGLDTRSDPSGDVAAEEEGRHGGGGEEEDGGGTSEGDDDRRRKRRRLNVKRVRSVSADVALHTRRSSATTTTTTTTLGEHHPARLDLNVKMEDEEEDEGGDGDMTMSMSNVEDPTKSAGSTMTGGISTTIVIPPAAAASTSAGAAGTTTSSTTATKRWTRRSSPDRIFMNTSLNAILRAAGMPIARQKDDASRLPWGLIPQFLAERGLYLTLWPEANLPWLYGESGASSGGTGSGKTQDGDEVGSGAAGGGSGSGKGGRGDGGEGGGGGGKAGEWRDRIDWKSSPSQRSYKPLAQALRNGQIRVLPRPPGREVLFEVMDPHGQVYDSTLGFSEDWKRKWMYSSSTSASTSTSKRGRVQRRASLMDVDEGGEAYRDLKKTEEEEKRGRSGYPVGLRSSLPSPPATTRIAGPSSRFPQASTSASTSTSFPRAPPATTTTTAGTSATGHRPQESRGPSTSFSNTISLSHRSQSHSYAATPLRGPPSPPQMSTQSSELPHPLYYRSIDGGGYPRSSLRSSPRLSGSGLGDTERPTTTVSAPGRREQASPSFRARQREEGTSAESSSSASFPLSTTPSYSLLISGRSSRRGSRGSAAVSASFSFPPLRRSNVVPLRSTHVTSSSPNTVALRNLPPSSSPSLAPLRPPLSSSSSSMTMDVSESDDDALLSNRLPPLQIPMDEDQRGDASIVSDILGLSGGRIGGTGSGDPGREGPSQHVSSSLDPPTTGTPTRRVSPPSVSTPTHLPHPTIAFSQPVWNAQDRTWRLTVIDFEQAALPPLGDAVVWDVDRNAWRLYWSEDGGGGETRGAGAGPRNVEVVGGASFALWSVEQDAWILES